MASELIERYLEHVRVEKRLAPRTVELYALDLARLSALAQGARVDLIRLQTSHLRHWVAQLHSGGASPRSIALILSIWRGFFRWLERQALRSGNPLQDLRPPKAGKPLPKALGVDEAQHLTEFKDPHSDPWLQARDAAMVELLYGSGLRVSELVGLDAQPNAQASGWIDLQDCQAHVLGKGSKRRSVPIGTKSQQALRLWLAQRDLGPGVGAADSPKANRSAALFIGRRGSRLSAQSIWQRLRRRGQLAGLAVAAHPHLLRHSFASHLLQSSGDLRAVQELLGHANIATTQIYTRLDFQHLAGVYDASHPRSRRKPGP